MKRAIFLLSASARDAIYDPETLSEIRSLVHLTDCADRLGRLDDLKPVLAETEIILSGWGMMPLDAQFLEAAPHLQAVFYGAGSVRGFVTDEFWRRGILLTSTYAANAVPVIEYTLSTIVFGLKRVIQARELTRHRHTFARPDDVKGLYGAKIGVIGAGMVGSGVLERLQSYDATTYCHDPYLSEEKARRLNTTPLGLDEIFSTCDVVTLHAANIPTTEHMIRGHHFRSMKDGAVFINTARGKIVKEDEMIEALRQRPIFAFIDVTDPEPPPSDSPLYDLPNVFLTPHLAGSGGDEVHRQGRCVLDELTRFLDGREPRYPVTRDMMEWMA